MTADPQPGPAPDEVTPPVDAPAPPLPYAEDAEIEPAAPSPASISFGLVEGWF